MIVGNYVEEVGGSWRIVPKRSKGSLWGGFVEGNPKWMGGC